MYKEQEIILTNNTKVYPAGRGKVVVISEKQVSRKQRKTKSDKITLASIKSNPNNITLVEYRTVGLKRIYMFPEGRQLSKEDRIQLISALMVTLIKNKFSYRATRQAKKTSDNEPITGQKHDFLLYISKSLNSRKFKTAFLGGDLVNEIDEQFKKDLRRYIRWLNKKNQLPQ